MSCSGSLPARLSHAYLQFDQPLLCLAPGPYVPSFWHIITPPSGVNVSGMVKGGRPSPGAWGCAPPFSSPTRRRRRRVNKEKEIFGDTPKPRQGCCAPCTFRRKQQTFKLTPKGDIPHPGRDAALPAPPLS